MSRLILPTALLAVLFAGPIPAAEKPPSNRLAKESSPYLLQHAHNPVDWYPWGPEAFEKAVKENKLVFLSVGYSSCHWCHVMEREAFSDTAVAKLLNEHFVCIKVDREERPDIDQVYIAALGVMGNPGGWPLSMFLTPDAKPFFGGTYWPVEDRVIDGAKIRGFKTLLGLVRGLWADKPDDVKEQADKVAQATASHLKRAARNVLGEKPTAELVKSTVDALQEEFDPVHGGFGSASRKWKGTKFPIPPSLRLLQQQAARQKSDEITGMVARTLDRMTRGGIFDQAGGGFHRYSTERTWTVPHFEKMLYDNGQLAEVYATAFAATGNPEYRRTLRETLAFVSRELTNPSGGFYSALDADSEGEEGRFYVWTEAELAAALTEKSDLDLARDTFGADDAPNFESKYFILTLPRPLAEVAKARGMSVEQLSTRLDTIRAKLMTARAARKRPFLDKKVLVGWNGLMIAGFAAAGKALDDPGYKATAAKAADFVLKNLRKDGRLLHVWLDGTSKIHAYLDDAAYLTHGLLVLHDATGDNRWLDEAKSLAAETEKHFADETGGYFFTPHDNEKLFARGKDRHDGALPSGNSVTAYNLVRLWRKTGDAGYKERAEKTLTAFVPAMKESPSGMPTMAEALAEYLEATEGLDKPGEKPAADKPKRSDAVVKVDVKAGKPAADGTQVLTVTLKVDKPWHIYGNPVGSELLESSRTEVRVMVDGKPIPTEPTYPKGTVTKDELAGDYVTLEGEVLVTVPVKRSADDKREWMIEVKFMACKEGTCLLPATVKQKLP